jgi:hypothetical protein
MELKDADPFTWMAPADGTGIELLPGPPPALRAPAGLALRAYEPLRQETGLFLTLAASDATPEGACAFANRYGLLGGRVPALVVRGVLREPEVEDFHKDWQPRVNKLRHFVALWEALRRGDGDAAREVVRRSGDQVLVRCDFPLDQSVGRFQRRGGFFVASPLAVGVLPSVMAISGDDRILAWWVLMHQINALLAGKVHLYLSWHPGASHPHLLHQPHTLWGAVCLQFAQAVGGNQDFQRCPVCSRWFLLEPGVNRANRLSCSSACRQRAHRLRVKRTRELRAEGKGFREIAKEVGSNVKTVKGWLSDTKGE